MEMFLNKYMSVKTVVFIYNFYALFVHVILQIGFIRDDIQNMQIINVISISLYILSFLLFKYKKYKIIYFIMIFELMSFAFITTFMLGSSSLFYTYNIAIVPIMSIYIYYEKFLEKKVSNIHIYTLLLFILLTVLFFIECTITNNQIKYTLSDYQMLFYIYINALNILIAILFGCLLFLYISSTTYKKLDKIIEESNYLATHDKLTGLANRNRLNEYLEEYNRNNIEYSVAIGDIDNFKNINDKYGHLCGDYVLKEVAKIIKETKSNSIKIFRFGGEEIIFVTEQCSDYLYNQVEVLRKVINDYDFEYDANKFNLTMTFGVSGFIKDFENTLREADFKLYTGKKSGKNKVVN